MLKLRLKRIGRKKYPVYRLIVIESLARRNGRAIEEVGYYNSITKESSFNVNKIKKWLMFGAKPTKTVLNLLKNDRII